MKLVTDNKGMYAIIDNLSGIPYTVFYDMEGGSFVGDEKWYATFSAINSCFDMLLEGTSYTVIRES